MATRIKMELRSLVPVMFDRFVLGYAGDQNDAEARKHASDKVYRDEAGKVCIPAAMVKAAIREASSEIGKKTESKKRRNAIRAGIFLFPEVIPIADEPDGIHPEPVTRKGSGGKTSRVVSYRPYVRAWECQIEAVLYGISAENFRQYLELAGMRYGLGAHRPEWGRFEVVSFDLVEED